MEYRPRSPQPQILRIKSETPTTNVQTFRTLNLNVSVFDFEVCNSVYEIATPRRVGVRNDKEGGVDTGRKDERFAHVVLFPH